MAEQGRRRQARRAFLPRMVVLAAALAASACVGRREPVRDTEVSPVDQPPRSEAGERNRVAVLVPLSGPNGGVGTSIANAAKLALRDSGGTALKLTVYDTSGGAAVAASAALTDGNRLFLGPLLAEDVRAVAPAARRGGVPIIAFSNDSAIAGGGTYILGFTPQQSIARSVGYARSQGARRFAALIPNSAYGTRARQALLAAEAKAAVRPYEPGTASLNAAARSLSTGPAHDAVLLADTSTVSAAAAPIVRGGAARGATLIGTELWSTDRTIGAKAALRGALFAGVPDARFDQLVTRYRAHYGKTPYRLASLGYDGVLLAVRIARDWDVGARFPDRLLMGADGFTGIDGAFRFRRDGTAERQLAVHRVTASGTTIVSPAAAGFAR